MTGVCFVCARQTELVKDHHVCERCHNPARCRREACLTARSGPTKAATGTRYRDDCLAALRSFGGQATSAQIADVTGLTESKVSASLRATKGVSFRKRFTHGAKGVWELETAATAN